MNPYNSGQQQQPPPPQMGMQQQQMGMPQQQMGMPQQQMGMPQQNMYPQVQMGPSFCDRWLAQNNPFSRVDKLIPADKAAIYKQIMGVALVAFVMACVDLGVLCVSAGYIGIPHILTVLTPLCDFIFSPSLYAIFCVGNALVLLVILFVNTGQIATCVAAGIVIPLMEIILSGIIIFLLSTMDPELGSRISSFVESCRNPQGGQGPAQMDAMRAPNASMPMPPPTTKPPQARESTARRLMQSMRYNPQPTPASQGGDLPPGWSIAREAGTGDVYYFHTDGRTTWDKPTHLWRFYANRRLLIAFQLSVVLQQRFIKERIIQFDHPALLDYWANCTIHVTKLSEYHRLMLIQGNFGSNTMCLFLAFAILVYITLQIVVPIIVLREKGALLKLTQEIQVING